MITVNTLALKEALSKCAKCAKNDKTAPLTQLINIKTQDKNTLVFRATDELNTFTYYLKDLTADFDDIDVCILIEQIVKLVSKFNGPKVDIFVSNSGNELNVNGDGNYKLSIPIDAEGNSIKFPELKIGDAVSDTYTGSVSTIISAAKYCEGSITKLTVDTQIEDYPRLNYYVGKDVLALDGFLVTRVSGDFTPFSMLVSPTVMKLLNCFTDSGFKAYRTKKYIVFECDDCQMTCVEPDGLDVFPTEVATSILDSVTGSSVKISASVLSSALNRLSLFVDENQDSNSVKLVFNESGMFAYTLDNSCVEQISSEYCDAFECKVCVSDFLSLIKAYSNEVLTLIFGDTSVIKVVCDNITQIVVIGNDEEQ